MTKEEKKEEVFETPVEKKEPKKVTIETLRGFSMPDGWLPRGTYTFLKKEADNLVKKGFAKKVTK